MIFDAFKITLNPFKIFFGLYKNGNKLVKNGEQPKMKRTEPLLLNKFHSFQITLVSSDVDT